MASKEKKIESLNKRIDYLEAQIEALEKLIRPVQDKIAQLKRDQGSLHLQICLIQKYGKDD